MYILRVCILYTGCVCVLPGSLGDGTPHIATPVTGVGDFEQVLVVFKHLTRSTNAEKHLVIMDDLLTQTLMLIIISSILHHVLRMCGENE